MPVVWYFCKKCNAKFSRVVTGVRGYAVCPFCGSHHYRVLDEKEIYE